MGVDRSDTRYKSFGGNIRGGAGHPGEHFTTDDDMEIGDLWIDTTNARLYINTTGALTGWKYAAMITTSTSSTSTSSSTSSSSSSSSSTTTMP